MIFSIQRFVEDYNARRNLEDVDQYAIKLANLYDAHRPGCSDKADFLKKMRRIRTSFFVANGLDRSAFEAQILGRLDRKFKKKINPIDEFPGGVTTEKRRLISKPRSIGNILNEFKKGVEARAVDAFWKSRTQNKLRSKPETIGQTLIAMFIRGVLNGKGLAFREVGSGIGFVDIVVLLSTTPHLIELKMLKGKMTGASQIQTYMRTEGRNTGWLVLFDARPSHARTEEIPSHIDVLEGRIIVLTIDINPTPPSKKT
ncbi:MAG: hypothetical protein AAFY56_16505 [Pseudomonadota bacterium]